MGLEKIITYNVGLGDCHLLVFVHKQQKYLLLVDFGTKNTRKCLQGVANKIKDEMCRQRVDKIDFLLTHLHEDHYNGVHHLRNEIRNIYTGTDLLQYEKVFGRGKEESIIDEMGIEVNKENMKILKKGINEIFEYSDHTKEKIDVLWPLETINTKSYRKFIFDNFPHDKLELEVERMYIDINGAAFNFTSVVFEASGIDEEKYLFTGDLINEINVYERGDKYLKLFSDEQLADIGKRYILIKMPHHGCETWPKELLKENGRILISWGKRYKTIWKREKFNGINILATNEPYNTVQSKDISIFIDPK